MSRKEDPMTHILYIKEAVDRIETNQKEQGEKIDKRFCKLEKTVESHSNSILEAKATIKGMRVVTAGIASVVSFCIGIYFYIKDKINWP